MVEGIILDYEKAETLYRNFPPHIKFFLIDSNLTPSGSLFGKIFPRLFRIKYESFEKASLWLCDGDPSLENEYCAYLRWAT